MAEKMIPLYGFVEGDTLGIVVLGYENETVQTLTEKLQASVELRVKFRENGVLTYKGSPLDPLMTLKQAGIEALERVDVRFPKSVSPQSVSPQSVLEDL